ncbi:Ammonium transporter 1 member 2 [Spatholobus suberectus]|nr:Ammonium transporter 1 member 2 [Spatholobus suberectus]
MASLFYGLHKMSLLRISMDDKTTRMDLTRHGFNYVRKFIKGFQTWEGFGGKDRPRGARGKGSF